MRSTTNRNVRGSSADRRARKAWLLSEFGDGEVAPCMMDRHHETCPGYVTKSTVTVDRWPVSGVDGGTYSRGNIRPAYPACNYSVGGALGYQRRAKAVVP